MLFAADKYFTKSSLYKVLIINFFIKFIKSFVLVLFELFFSVIISSGLKGGFMKKIQNKLIELFNRYKHVWILSYFIIYLTWFGYLERTVTTHYHLIHLPIDDYIPFCEYFVIPYIMWFGYVAFGIAFTALHDKKEFYRLCAFLYTGMTVFLVISTLYPNGHNLRPYYFTHHNMFTALCEWLYSTDTPTNLFPSIHVYNSLGIHFAVMHSSYFKDKKHVQHASLVLCVLIILSTMFIKQHSVFDVSTAFMLAFVMYNVVYIKNWMHLPQKSGSFQDTANSKVRV